MKKRIIIFGGSGFLGTNLSKKLALLNYEVIVIDINNKNIQFLNNIKFIKMDLTRINIEENFNFKKSDIFINLASRQYHNKIPYLRRQEWFDDLNFNTSKNIMKLALKYNVSGFIFFSTDMVYGLPSDKNFNELDLTNPIGEYGKSKLKAEKSLIKLANNNLPLTIFRPRLISGSGRLGIFKKLFNHIHNNKVVPLIGNGNNCYQMVSVDDCSSAVMLAIEKNIPNEIFNLGSKEKISVKNLIKNLIIYANSNSSILPINAQLIKRILYICDFIGLSMMYKEQYSIADKNIYLDISKANNILNWYPKYDDQLMINNAFDYWKNSI